MNLTSGLFSSSLAEVIGSYDPPIEVVFIAGGSYQMGDHADVGNADEKPVHTEMLTGFWIDKYEVTRLLCLLPERCLHCRKYHRG